MPGQIEDAPTSAQMEVALLQKLLAAALAIDSIDKDGTNKFHAYSYASAESYLFTCRKELLSRGVLILGAQTGTSERMRDTSQGESAITTVGMIFKVYDTETGFALEIPWAGRGEDPMDKGLSKGLTNAIKTFLRQQLLLPTGDDPEADASTDERARTSSGTPYGQARTGAAVGTTNLVNEARGLSDDALSAVLEANGIDTGGRSPFGFFARIPDALVDSVRDALAKAHG
jgi:hypothetical protein